MSREAMWVVFWRTRKGEDAFSVCEDERKARVFYKKVLDNEDIYCAGLGPITWSTEGWHIA